MILNLVLCLVPENDMIHNMFVFIKLNQMFLNSKS